MSHLALKGGRPVRTEDFHTWPLFDQREEETVLQVLRSGKWWRYSFGEGIDFHEPSGGSQSQVLLFQQAFAAHQGARFGIGCSSGTAALDLVIRALDIGPGSEVIVPAYTFVAGATCVLQSNAVPVFVDIDPETYNIDPQRVEEAITPNTAAVIPCHFGGQVADMDRLSELARRHGIHLIEDAAHAHGARWRNRGAGTTGVAGTFSFQHSKNMTAGEGGIVISNDERLAERVESLTWSGRKRGRPWYEYHELGWNYRLTEIQGAILMAQLARLDEQNRRRRENADYLTEQLREIQGLKPLFIDERARAWSVHLLIVRYDPAAFQGLPRARLVQALNAEGIPVSEGYTHPLYRNPMFLNKSFYGKGCPFSCGSYENYIDYASFEERCPVAERACAFEALWLEQRLFLGSRRDMDDIAEGFKKVKQHIHELL